MKRFIAALTVAALVVPATAAFAAGQVKLIVDGREIRADVPPQLTDGRIMVPVRWVAEALGAGVRWERETNAVQIETRPSEPPRERHNPRYYPRVPEKITSPEMALEAYFDALYYAADLGPDQRSAGGGTVGMEREPYPTAYGYWSKEWQAEHPYEEFLAQWQGTAHVELLQLFDAGMQPGNGSTAGQPRYFVEVKTLEAAEDKPGLGVFYYTGFFTVRHTEDGWRITGGGLEPEKLGWRLGGHQPWLGNPEMVAHVELAGSVDEPLGKAITTRNPDGTATVRYVNADGAEIHRVVLVQAEDGIWRCLTKK